MKRVTVGLLILVATALGIGLVFVWRFSSLMAPSELSSKEVSQGQEVAHAIETDLPADYGVEVEVFAAESDQPTVKTTTNFKRSLSPTDLVSALGQVREAEARNLPAGWHSSAIETSAIVEGRPVYLEDADPAGLPLVAPFLGLAPEQFDVVSRPSEKTLQITLKTDSVMPERTTEDCLGSIRQMKDVAPRFANMSNEVQATVYFKQCLGGNANSATDLTVAAKGNSMQQQLADLEAGVEKQNRLPS